MGIFKDQRGIAPIAIVLAVLVLAVAGGAFYFVKNANDNKNSSLTPEQQAAVDAASEACDKAYGDKDYCKFVSNWTFGGETKMTITTPEDDTVSVFETDSQGNSRMTATQGGEETYETIVIGNTSYIKNAEAGNWMKYTSEQADPSAPSTDDFKSEFDFDDEVAKDTSKIKSLGKEACGNLNCFKYSMTDTSAPEDETIVWFDDKDYKLRKMTTSSSNGKSEMTFEYSVSPITEPSPVVEAPAAGAEMTQEQIEELMKQYAQ